MSDNTVAAGRARSVTAKRQAAKPLGGERQPADKSVRLQLHLGEQTVKRLGVHAALTGRNQSRLADEILTAYLARFGKGRELFGPASQSDQVDPVSTEGSED